jgi:hypothetical protein
VRAAQARAERDWLVAALSGASAIGNRTRRFTDDPERARVAVGKAIRRAIARIAEEDAVIGEALRSRVRPRRTSTRSTSHDCGIGAEGSTHASWRGWKKPAAFT